jgi:hypothetical protein
VRASLDWKAPLGLQGDENIHHLPASPTWSDFSEEFRVQASDGPRCFDQSEPDQVTSSESGSEESSLFRSVAFDPQRAEISRGELVDLLRSSLAGNLSGRFEVFLARAHSLESNDLGAQLSAESLLGQIQKSKKEIYAESMSGFEETMGLSFYQVFEVSGPIDEPRLRWMGTLGWVSDSLAHLDRSQIQEQFHQRFLSPL